MAITYDWIVEQLEVYPELEGYNNVVFNVHWRVNANENNNFATYYGTQNIYIDLDGDFISYDELTEKDVIGWVKNDLGHEQVGNIEMHLLDQVNSITNPITKIIPLPWADN